MTRREEDFVEELFICSTHDFIMFFTSKGRCFRLKGYEIKRRVAYITPEQILSISFRMVSDEKVTALIKVTPDEYEREDRCLVMVTRKGLLNERRWAHIKMCGVWD